MTGNSSYEIREKIYLEHLRELKNIKFTSREIDIIVCILHNRSEKKIAYILQIMPKTVSSHVSNIMQKMRCNSKEYIIDFFESSGKMQFIHQYYACLLVDGNFKKYLIKIGKQINKHPATYIVDFNLTNDSKKQNKFFNRLSEHLKLANISIQVEKNSINEFFIEEKKIQNEGYYKWVFQFIKEIIKNNEIDQIILEFEEECKLIDNPLVNTEILGPNISSYTFKRFPSKIKLYALSIMLSMIIIYISFIIWNNKKAAADLKLSNLQLTLSNNIYHVLTKYYEGLSVRNLSIEESDKNYSIIKQFDEIVREILSDQINNNFDSSKLQSNEFINCLYNLNAISGYILFREHDAKKAEKILKYAKNLAENYVMIRSKLQINFDKLIPEEVYTELSIIKDLPEMYTEMLYLLGRSYVYQRNIEPAKKCFELARFLGKKLELFVGYLSVGNGLGILKGDEADINIKNKEYEQAKLNLKEAIELYNKLKDEENKEYKTNYKPNNNNPETIIPKKDINSAINSVKRTTILYTKLIAITDNKADQEKYLQEISEQFLGNNISVGILEILATKSNNTLARIIADLYNVLGYLLLELDNKDIDFRQFKNAITAKLHLKNSDNLRTIYQIFELAKSLSRNIEFSKADAYHGLAKVCERLIKNPDITTQDKNELTVKIHDFKKARDEINQKLERKN